MGRHCQGVPAASKAGRAPWERRLPLFTRLHVQRGGTGRFNRPVPTRCAERPPSPGLHPHASGPRSAPAGTGRRLRLENAKQPQGNDDRNRNSDQPKQTTFQHVRASSAAFALNAPIRSAVPHRPVHAAPIVMVRRFLPCGAACVRRRIPIRIAVTRGDVEPFLLPRDAAGLQEAVTVRDLPYCLPRHNGRVEDDAEIIMSRPRHEHRATIDHMVETTRGSRVTRSVEGARSHDSPGPFPVTDCAGWDGPGRDKPRHALAIRGSGHASISTGCSWAAAHVWTSTLRRLG